MQRWRNLAFCSLGVHTAVMTANVWLRVTEMYVNRVPQVWLDGHGRSAQPRWSRYCRPTSARAFANGFE
jgi:hypothetical protein